jgi:hypothetical protein
MKRWARRGVLLLVVAALPVALWLGIRDMQRDECFLGDGSLRDEGQLGAYNGLTVEQAKQRAADDGDVLRVIGQDGDCFDRTSDRRNDRVNVYVEDGEVVRARAY